MIESIAKLLDLSTADAKFNLIWYGPLILFLYFNNLFVQIFILILVGLTTGHLQTIKLIEKKNSNISNKISRMKNFDDGIKISDIGYSSIWYGLYIGTFFLLLASGYVVLASTPNNIPPISVIYDGSGYFYILRYLVPLIIIEMFASIFTFLDAGLVKI